MRIRMGMRARMRMAGRMICFAREKAASAVLVALVLAAVCCLQRTALAETAPEEKILVDITMEGGSGRAYIQSPVEVVSRDGAMTAKLVWSSRNYDYMIVGGVRYENENAGGESTFTIPVATLDEPLPVIGDTLAMSTPHEIEYVITWHPSSEEGASGSADPETADPEDGGPETADPEDGGPAHSGPEALINEAFENAGTTCTGTMDLHYAVGFRASYYDDYTVISIDHSGTYLLVPEGGEPPEGIPEETVILRRPLDRTYLVSTSAMDLICTCGALERVRLSGTRESDWYIEEARDAMQSGSIIYAGKYRAPDYETILSEGCSLAIENTMIYHEPAVKAKLEELGIPVLVETSSYETHPLGRLEWIRLYGMLFDREAEADAWYDEQLRELEPLLQGERDTGKSAAFFHVTSNGMITVRKPGDYITRMIELSGGHYILPSTDENENALSTMNMQMEDFYAAASEADVILYNSTIGGEIGSVSDLTGMNALFADFKAVKEGQVYCVDRGFFQHITGMAGFIKDLERVWNGAGDQCTYLKKLD